MVLFILKTKVEAVLFQGMAGVWRAPGVNGNGE